MSDWRPFEPSRDEAERIKRERYENTCNLHNDCAAADERARKEGRLRADHCHDECCEECFGS